MVRMTPVHVPEKVKPARDITGVTLAGNLPVLEHAKNGHALKIWRLWVSYDDTLKDGVYLELHPDGSIRRCVSHNGKVKWTQIKP